MPRAAPDDTAAALLPAGTPPPAGQKKKLVGWCCTAAVLLAAGAAAGYFQKKAGSNRSPVDACAAAVCAVHSTCSRNSDDGYTCTCDAGYQFLGGRCDHCKAGFLGDHCAVAFALSGANYTSYNGVYTETDRVCNGKPVFQQGGGDGFTLFWPTGQANWLASTGDATTCEPGGNGIYISSTSDCPVSPDGTGCAGRWLEKDFNSTWCPNPSIAIVATEPELPAAFVLSGAHQREYDGTYAKTTSECDGKPVYQMGFYGDDGPVLFKPLNETFWNVGASASVSTNCTTQYHPSSAYSALRTKFVWRGVLPGMLPIFRCACKYIRRLIKTALVGLGTLAYYY